MSLVACSMSDLVNGQSLPSDTKDPAVIKTPEGAVGAYQSAVSALRDVIGGSSVFPGYSVVKSSGLLTDELQAIGARLTGSNEAFPSNSEKAVDARADAVELSGPYNGLQIVRARAREAIGALRKYRPDASSVMVGHLFAIEGMAEVLLAEFYCSGIPLSTLDFERDYTVKPGSSTETVFQHALMLFDSAAVFAADSARILHFTSLGRARALLGLHNVAAAAQTVSDVPTTYLYKVSFQPEFVSDFMTQNNSWFASVANREGGIGLPFVTSGDPRTLSDSLTGTGGPWVPRKYLSTDVSTPGTNSGIAPIVFASGIEARLIEAEAALASNEAQWLTMLNALRTSCIVDESCPSPAPAGTGGIANLPLLDDPGLDPLPNGKTVRDVRLDLIFAERAYWLFLTGRRQADLRRLVQQYDRERHTVYPSGYWGQQQLAVYGQRISFPVPFREQETNPLYHGCEDT